MFTATQDELAFAELVARHGPLVLRVCRRVLHHEQDAEDAFQATFLILARCHGSIRKCESLTSWLYGVAYRTAMKAKRSATRRRNHEARSQEGKPQTVASPSWDDVQAILDEEIQRLPETFRSAFVLCVLEGKTIPAAAAELQCKEGTVSSRLGRARQRLQQQLSRRGIQLPALLAALCVADSARATVPGELARSAIRFGLLGTAGGPAVKQIPPVVAALAAGVSRAMLLTKAKIATAVFLLVSLFAAGVSVLMHQPLTAKEPPLPTARKVDAAPPKVDKFEDLAQFNYGGGMVSGTGIRDKGGFTVVSLEAVAGCSKLAVSFAVKEDQRRTLSDFRVVVVDAAGKRHHASAENKVYAGGNGIMVFTYVSEFNLARDKIDSLVIQQRARGTRAVAIKLSRDQKIPGDVLPGTAIDVVAEISEPIQTSIALLNVKVLAIARDAGEQAVTVQVTPEQVAVLALMQQDGTKLGIKLREKEKPRK